MKKFLIYFGIVILIIAAFSFGKSSQKDMGRYQIFMHPTFRADEYLLDTQTGRTWQMTLQHDFIVMYFYQLLTNYITLLIHITSGNLLENILLQYCVFCFK